MSLTLYVTFGRLNGCWHVKESPWHKAAATANIFHKTTAGALRWDTQAGAVLGPSYGRQDNGLPVVSLPRFGPSLCVCVSVFSGIAVSQNREAQNWKNGCGRGGETAVERPGCAKVLLRSFIVWRQLATTSSVSPRCKGLAASHNNEHLCREAPLL